MRLSATLRPVTRLTGSLGVATITTFGDATAVVSDILAPKTAYIATGKVTGTCTFDSDTSDATAVESDLLLGKTAYAGGVELTGSCTYDADTSDATLTANDMLYGVTGYGADGTKLTGAGAHWQYVKSMGSAFYGNTELPDVVSLYLPSCNSIGASFRNAKCRYITLTTAKLVAGGLSYAFYNLFPGFLQVTLYIDTSEVTNWTLVFSTNSSLATIDGTPLDVRSSTADLGFLLLPALVTITFVANTIKVNASFVNSPLLSIASLLSIANGLDAGSAPKTLTMHATAKTNMDAIIVDNNAGVAEQGSAMTLTQFINNIKGWTIA